MAAREGDLPGSKEYAHRPNLQPESRRARWLVSEPRWTLRGCATVLIGAHIGHRSDEISERPSDHRAARFQMKIGAACIHILRIGVKHIMRAQRHRARVVHVDPGKALRAAVVVVVPSH